MIQTEWLVNIRWNAFIVLFRMRFKLQSSFALFSFLRARLIVSIYILMNRPISFSLSFAWLPLHTDLIDTTYSFDIYRNFILQISPLFHLFSHLLLCVGSSLPFSPRFFYFFFVWIDNKIKSSASYNDWRQFHTQSIAKLSFYKKKVVLIVSMCDWEFCAWLICVVRVQKSENKTITFVVLFLSICHC